MEDIPKNFIYTYLYYAHEEVATALISSSSCTSFVDLVILKNFNMIVGPHILGPVHADELGYEFRAFFFPELEAESEDIKLLRRLVKMWTNFAKYG
jgi:hypothetical protein